METRKMVWVGVDRRYVLDWFFLHASKLPEYIMCPRVRGLPEGFKVRSVQYDFLSDCFQFLIEHESFAEVPDGMPAPRWEGQQWVTHEWHKISDGLKPQTPPDGSHGIYIPSWEFPPQPDIPKPGTKEAVLRYFGVFADENPDTPITVTARADEIRPE